MNHLTRRDFIQTSAGAAAAGLTASRTIRLDAETETEAQSPGGGPASDRVRFGIIGVGMQGSGLLSNAVEIPGVECVAASDLYDGRHTLAKEIAGPNITTTRRYKEVLHNKSIDCVIVAVPDHWHKQVVIDAVSAGKDVYCEKPMSHTIHDGEEMVKAARASGRIVQVGSQRVSSLLFGKAKDMVAKGDIGDLIAVELALGRNSPSGAWEYPPPLDLSAQNVDWDTWQGTTPKKPFDPLAFTRWRCWREYGTGVAGDLMVHLLSGMQFATGLNRMPDRVSAVGGIVRWKDGRDMPDLHMAHFNYGEAVVTVRLTLGTETPEMTRILGSRGSIEISGTTVTYSPQRGIDTSPSYYCSSFPRAMREEYVRQWHAENDAKLAEQPLDETTIYKGPNYDDTRPHLRNFFSAVRSRKPVVEDAEFGHNAAGACHMANESYFRGQAITKAMALGSNES